jgi:hypothetical protein
MDGLVIDNDGLANCDCGVVGFEVTFGADGAVELVCVSCGNLYSTQDVERARKEGRSN